MTTEEGKQNKITENEGSAESTEIQKVAVNPNPAANANVQETPFEKTAQEDKEGSANDVGTEITDGEAG